MKHPNRSKRARAITKAIKFLRLPRQSSHPSHKSCKGKHWNRAVMGGG